MTIASVSTTRLYPSRPWPASLVRIAAVLAMAVALTAGFLATGHESAAQAIARDGPELTRLLRSMAALKMLMAAAASAALLWRLGSTATLLWLTAYATAAVAMWIGPGLIWQMAHLKLGALCLHAGLFGSLVLLWRDPVVGDRLAAIIARRRNELRSRASPAPR